MIATVIGNLNFCISNYVHSSGTVFWFCICYVLVIFVILSRPPSISSALAVLLYHFSLVSCRILGFILLASIIGHDSLFHCYLNIEALFFIKGKAQETNGKAPETIHINKSTLPPIQERQSYLAKTKPTKSTTQKLYLEFPTLDR